MVKQIVLLFINPSSAYAKLLCIWLSRCFSEGFWVEFMFISFSCKYLFIYLFIKISLLLLLYVMCSLFVSLC